MGTNNFKLVANNKKAYHDYFIDDKYETGIELYGTEVKSIRMGKCSIKEAFVRIENGQVYIYGMHISPYEKGNIFNKDPLRVRKLLLHKSEINKLIDKAVELGLPKILVNHPFFHIGATVDDMVHWADQGAYIELNAVVFNDVEPASHHLPISIAQEVLDRVGYQRIVVDSDMGQSVYKEPVSGLQTFAQVLMEKCGATEEQLRVMMIENPAKLMDISL